MPIMAMLINRALESGALYAAEHADGYVLMVKVFGVGVQIAGVSHDELKELRRPKLVPVQ